jgi:cathepsin B
MAKSKSPRKDGAEATEADPDARERARKAQAERSKKKEDLLDKYSYHIVFGVLIFLVLVAVVNSLWKSGPDVHSTEVNDPEYIASLNGAGRSFTVGPTPMFEGYKLVDAKRTINVQASNKQQLYKCNTGSKDTIVPESYNFREQYPNCARPVLTQGNCSSSYSIASISAITDRWCRSNELEYPTLSAHSPVFCDKVINSNCKGGFVSRTLDYGKIYGFVDTKCAEYDAAAEETEEQCIERTKTCQKYTIGDYCVSSESENIKQEIFNYGPVIVTIPVYRDFLIYKSGLYQVYPKNQRFSAEHAVKIIGWDVIDGKNCWLIENSWGEDWGKNGTA